MDNAAYPMLAALVKVNPNTLLSRHGMDARNEPQLEQPQRVQTNNALQVSDKYLPAEKLPLVEDLGDLLPYMARLRENFPFSVNKHKPQPSIAAPPTTLGSLIAAGAAAIYRAVSGTTSTGTAVSDKGGSSSSANSQVISWGVISESEDEDDESDSSDADNNSDDDEQQEQYERQQNQGGEQDEEEGWGEGGEGEGETGEKE